MPKILIRLVKRELTGLDRNGGLYDNPRGLAPGPGPQQLESKVIRMTDKRTQGYDLSSTLVESPVEYYVDTTRPRATETKPIRKAVQQKVVTVRINQATTSVKDEGWGLDKLCSHTVSNLRCGGWTA